MKQKRKRDSYFFSLCLYVEHCGSSRLIMQFDLCLKLKHHTVIDTNRIPLWKQNEKKNVHTPGESL